MYDLGSFGPSELSVIERCPFYRGVRKERFDCTFENCAVPEIIHIPPTEGHWKFLWGGGGGGGLKSKLLEEKHELKLNWNFLGAEGVQNRKPSMGGVWKFSGTKQ